MNLISHTTTCRGLKTAWLSGGKKDAPIMMFIHGFPDDPFVWKPQMEHFKKKYHIIAPYLRGTAGSRIPANHPSKSLARYGLDAIALDHLEILKQEDPRGKRKIILVGHDLGSIHAWHLAPLLGKRLKALIYTGGGSIKLAVHRLKNVRQLKKSWYMFFFQLPIISDLGLKFLGPTIFEFQKKHSGIRPEYLEESFASHVYAREAFNQYRAMRGDLIKAVRQKDDFKLAAPVLAIGALGDAYVLPTTLEEARMMATNPTVRIVEGHHWLMLENPELMNRLMEKFLESMS